jgi:sn-glycerol 3-phosphate transport system substrate-binding protein
MPAQVEIQWWHAMTGANNDVVVKLAEDFNASQRTTRSSRPTRAAIRTR